MIELLRRWWAAFWAPIARALAEDDDDDERDARQF